MGAKGLGRRVVLGPGGREAQFTALSMLIGGDGPGRVLVTYLLR